MSGLVIIVKIENEEQKKEIMKNKHKLRGEIFSCGKWLKLRGKKNTGKNKQMGKGKEGERGRD